MRVATLSFTRAVLLHLGGVEKRLFVDMINALPEGSTIAGMGEDQVNGSCHLFVLSPRFKECLDFHVPPRITAFFRRDPESGEPHFEKLDMSEALEQTLECQHQWKEYVGAMHRFNYCVKCNEKEKS